MTRALIPLVLALSLAAPVAASAPAAPRTGPWKRASELVFFAVLEGLYTDGVSQAAVEAVIGKPGRPDHERFKEHFVYACPLCHPAYEAFKLYQKREAFYGMKQPIDTLGPGLAPDPLARLQDPDRAVRLAAIQELLERWVQRRLEMMRLTGAERDEIAGEMEDARKQGMEMLERLRAEPGFDPARRSCAICDGAAGACGFG